VVRIPLPFYGENQNSIQNISVNDERQNVSYKYTTGQPQIEIYDSSFCNDSTLEKYESSSIEESLSNVELIHGENISVEDSCEIE